MIIALAVLVAVIFFQVVMRYVFNNSPSWSEEFSRYLFVWFSWIGVSAGLKDGEHLKVELLSISLMKRGFVKSNELVNILVSLVWFFTTAIVTYYGIEVVMYQMDMNVLTPAMRAPVWIAYLSIPVCSGVVGIRLIVNMIQSLMVIFGKANSESEVAK
jgi:TRAP-type C4-dicarboxylate transport system permease small subunit